MEIYRSEMPGLQSDHLYLPRTTMRIPSNVPYIIDNLWEWKRPSVYPNRRHSIYASPCPILASQLGRKDGQVYKIEVCDDVIIAQLNGYEDSKFHPECKEIKNLLLALFGISGNNSKWKDLSIEEKSRIGLLWVPGLTKEQVEDLFESVVEMSVVKDDVYEMIKYWDEVSIINKNESLNPRGEVFFSGAYRVKSVDI